MKKAIIFLFFIFLISQTFSQTVKYPFYIEKTGNGEQSIFFIPGFASSGEVWKETKLKFNKNFTCYTLTMSGFAGIPPQSNATFFNWVHAIANYIINNKINKSILVGHSMGGTIALAISSDYPELIDKIIVVDALPFLQEINNPNAKSNVNNDCTAIVEYFTKMSDEEFYQMQKKSIPNILANADKSEMVVDWSLKSDRKTFATIYCDFWNTDLRDKMTNIQCKALILLESPFTILKDKIENQYKNLKTANLQYATKGLHFIMYDDSEWYFEQLMDFIEKK